MNSQKALSLSFHFQYKKSDRGFCHFFILHKDLFYARSLIALTVLWASWISSFCFLMAILISSET